MGANGSSSGGGMGIGERIGRELDTGVCTRVGQAADALGNMSRDNFMSQVDRLEATGKVTRMEALDITFDSQLSANSGP